MRYLILILVVFSSCSLEKRLYSKQRKVNKLEFQIHEIKKELNLPLDSVIFSSDTVVIEKRILKYDTIKLKCNERNEVVFFDNNEPVESGEIIRETETIYKDKIIQKDVLKTKKEIVYIEKKLNNKQLAVMAIGFVTILVGLMYALGSLAGFVIKLLINKKHLS
jgi:hypothetical protein